MSRLRYSSRMQNPQETPRLGLRENLGQFSLLVLINAFVGAMVGLERTVLPLLAEKEFGIASHTAILSFIISFGIVKAITNYFAGAFSDKIGRKKLLIAGWIAALPVPILVMFAPTWNWVVAANLLLGINQGLCWSTTVIMKIDLVGPRRRGLAMGFNEFAGYVSVALAALASGYIASAYALRPQPFYPGIAFAILGLVLSIFFVRETHGHALQEAKAHGSEEGTNEKSNQQVFALTTWKNKTLFSCSQAGLVNNLNDGMTWGLLPIFFASAGLPIDKIGELAAIYPAAWGFLQLYTGHLSDRVGRKWMIVSGMLTQAIGIFLIPVSKTYGFWFFDLLLLGIGTALVYPTLLAAIGDVAHPAWRASAVGVYRLWRDLGYAIGAIISGVIADWFGIVSAIELIAFLTLLSGITAAIFMRETLSAEVKKG
jgi:MFS family permease